MNENDRTILEQAIYEEMELTPEIDPLHPHALRCLPFAVL